MDTKGVLSIDIGLKNMSFCFLSFVENNIVKLDFELYNLADYGIKKKSVGLVEQRCTAIREILGLAIDKLKSDFETNLEYVIIEKQVPSNENAMCIMYALYCGAINYISPEKVTLFDPKMKFTTLGKSYDTKNKNHKKQSIKMVLDVFTNLNFPELIEKFNHYDKKDDIADSVNQSIIWMYKNNILNSESIIKIFNL